VHLAIMCGQLGNEWNVRFQQQCGMKVFHSKLGWISS
jgi:hypothetical protein